METKARMIVATIALKEGKVLGRKKGVTGSKTIAALIKLPVAIAIDEIFLSF